MSFNIYFAGGHSGETEEYIIKNNFNRLLSQINERKIVYKYIEAKKNGWQGKLLIDSGAFSVHKSGKTVDLNEYIEFLNANHEYLDYYIQLDDIPGKWGQQKTIEQITESPKKSWNNYLYMISKLIEPDKLLPVFHQGENFKYLEQMLEFKNDTGEHIKYICLSSNKELPTKERILFYKKCYEIIHKSSNPDVKIHSLGTQSKIQCESFPFTSSDATSWILTAANGNIYTKYGTILISDMQNKDKNNILNNVAIDVFKKYIEEKGYTIEELSKDYKQRIKWNVDYLGNWAKNEYEYKGPKVFKDNYLF